MKIIIDIPEQNYIYITKKHCLPSCDDRTLRGAYYEMISRGIPLDKIRAEIEQYIDKEKLNFGGQFDNGLNLALKIIDRYKSESEG